MHAQTTEWLQGHHFFGGILVALAGIGLVIASIVGIRALTDGQSVSQTPDLSPVNLVEEDPLLPEGWVDSYFNRPVVISVEQDPPLPAGWIDSYVNRSAVKPNITTLTLDRDGADVILTNQADFAHGASITAANLDRASAIEAIRLNDNNIVDYAGMDRASAIDAIRLDQDGADIPEGNWWGRSDFESTADVAPPFPASKRR